MLLELNRGRLDLIAANFDGFRVKLDNRRVAHGKVREQGVEFLIRFMGAMVDSVAIAWSKRSLTCCISSPRIIVIRRTMWVNQSRVLSPIRMRRDSSWIGDGKGRKSGTEVFAGARYASSLASSVSRSENGGWFLKRAGDACAPDGQGNPMQICAGKITNGEEGFLNEAHTINIKLIIHPRTGNQGACRPVNGRVVEETDYMLDQLLCELAAMFHRLRKAGGGGGGGRWSQEKRERGAVSVHLIRDRVGEHSLSSQSLQLVVGHNLDFNAGQCLTNTY
ncbi:hypothetical protein C8R44DRAFT_725143 [Mycena epipterygia]|nr:hypothetical protein C8R44DRAFT_725143 [Mycena epipterygia]